MITIADSQKDLVLVLDLKLFSYNKTKTIIIKLNKVAGVYSNISPVRSLKIYGYIIYGDIVYGDIIFDQDYNNLFHYRYGTYSDGVDFTIKGDVKDTSLSKTGVSNVTNPKDGFVNYPYLT